MAILHKNITATADIHNPKWFTDANNGDYAFKNEKGELESIDELLLPAALNFVDGSVAPPTTSTGDIYILSSGGSVNAGWGSVSLQDWVRYDGTAWNSITPQKSSLCYDKTADSLMSFNGTAWSAIGGGGGTDVNAVHVNVASEISGITAKATPTTSDIILIEDAADSNNKKKITIGDLPASAADTIYTADGTLTGDRTINLNSAYDLIFENSGSSSNFKLNNASNGYVLNNRSGGIKIRPSLAGNQPLVISNTSDNFDTFTIKANGGGEWSAYNGVKIGELTLNDYARFTISALEFFNSGLIAHSIGFENNGSDVYFHGNGITQNNHFSVGAKLRVLTESISLQGETLIKGAGTSTSSSLAIYNNDTTPIKNIDFLDNGRVKFLNLPTSSSGLSSGDLWNDGGTVKIV